jgi:transcriptional regulator with XRE-family HTH domain
MSQDSGNTATGATKASLGGKLLKVWLTNNNRSYGWLARKLGITRSAVSQWLLGWWVPRYPKRAAIEELTGVPAWAWGRHEENGDE